jgi:hypothetical protein
MDMPKDRIAGLNIANVLGQRDAAMFESARNCVVEKFRNGRRDV